MQIGLQLSQVPLIYDALLDDLHFFFRLRAVVTKKIWQLFLVLNNWLDLRFEILLSSSKLKVILCSSLALAVHLLPCLHV